MTQSTHPDIGKRVLVECIVKNVNEYHIGVLAGVSDECIVKNVNEYHIGVLAGVSDEWYELITDEDVIYRFMPEYWKYTVMFGWNPLSYWERKAIPTEQEQHINELEEQIEEMKQEVSAMEQKVAELKGSL